MIEDRQPVTPLVMVFAKVNIGRLDSKSGKCFFLSVEKLWVLLLFCFGAVPDSDSKILNSGPRSTKQPEHHFHTSIIHQRFSRPATLILQAHSILVHP